MDDIGAPPQDPGLSCFGGNPAPPLVTQGYQRLVSMPESARKAFWNLLDSILEEPGHPDHETHLEQVSRDHDLAEAEIRQVIQACDTLLHQAAAFDLGRERFQQDLEALPGTSPEEVEPFLARYGALKPELRQRILRETLADHGKVLLGLDWRVDRVLTSDRGVGLEGTVIFLTLRYREGERMDRVTLQLTPEGLAELKRFAGRISG